MSSIHYARSNAFQEKATLADLDRLHEIREDLNNLRHCGERSKMRRKSSLEDAEYKLGRRIGDNRQALSRHIERELGVSVVKIRMLTSGFPTEMGSPEQIEDATAKHKLWKTRKETLRKA